MLPATDDESEHVREYMQSEAPDLTVTFLQKVYGENVLHVRHDVWDVHTDVDRWWVITSPINLYAQEQFPNMDLALTFHVGLCLRIPRSERQKLSELPVEPFAESLRYLGEASDGLKQATEVSDYQARGCVERRPAPVGEALEEQGRGWRRLVRGSALAPRAHSHQRTKVRRTMPTGTPNQAARREAAQALALAIEETIEATTAARVRSRRPKRHAEEGAPPECRPSETVCCPSPRRYR